MIPSQPRSAHRRPISLGRPVPAGFALLVLTLAACDVVQPPARFAVGDTLQLGELRLAVVGWEPVAADHGPVPGLDAGPGGQAIAVFARCTGLEGFTEVDRYRFVETFLESRLELREGWRGKHKPVNALPRDVYDSRPELGPCTDWTIVFHAPEDADCFDLRVTHPEPRRGEFRAATVPLCSAERVDENGSP